MQRHERPQYLLTAACLSLLCCAACSGVSSNAASAEPRWSSSARAGALDLLGVDLINANDGWAVGEIDPRGLGGAVYRTADAGRHWQPIAAKTEVFSAVDFINAQTGWIAGFAGRIERTDDGGVSWTSQRGERGVEALNAICAIDDRRAWAVGVRGLALRTDDGGATWMAVATGRSEDLWAVRFATPEHGWITGDGGVILGTVDGGAHWTRATSTTSNALYGLATVGQTTAIAVGQAGTIIRTEDGASWTAIASNVTDNLNAVAASASRLLAVGAHGAIVESKDAGRSWTLTPGISSVNLLAAALLDDTHALAVGQRGTVLSLK
jgi:photosystem II stability/assembly factor-like uncharacterized protein